MENLNYCRPSVVPDMPAASASSPPPSSSHSPTLPHPLPGPTSAPLTFWSHNPPTWPFALSSSTRQRALLFLVYIYIYIWSGDPKEIIIHILTWCFHKLLDSWIPGFLDSWVDGFLGYWVLGFLGYWVPRFLCSWVPGYWITSLLGHRNIGGNNNTI